MADPVIITGPIQIKRRAAGGAAGSPATLKSGELAWNNVDQTLYIGAGDNGSGVATSILAVGGYLKYVELGGAQTIAGIKTFSSSPLVPTPATNDDSLKAANTAWVRDIIEGFGAGDMSKATYDPNNDGKVTAAESADTAPWSGITGKPTEFPPAPFDAAKIAFGTIDPARLPVLPSSVQIASSGSIADLTAGQQADIGDGSIVTTTDGRRWVYTGSGSKTAETSYITLADITPLWSVIEGKPTTLAGYGITDAQPLDATLTALAGLATGADKVPLFTGTDVVSSFTVTAFSRTLLDDADAGTMRVTLGLGTMAVQNANAVAITGGTISGVTAEGIWDGGTF